VNSFVRAVVETRRWAERRPQVIEWRRRRYELFVEVMTLRPTDTILDVGCGGGGALMMFNSTNSIVGLDLDAKNRASVERHPNATFTVGDARELPFDDGAFEIVFCNSLIEHVEPVDRQAVADEIRRVGVRYFVQTPNRGFPIEPHFMLPLVQFWPVRARDWLHRHFGAGYVRLLDSTEFTSLFPDAQIHRERFWGLTKSLMAVR
jgi:SAM-dependent methyltransferase